MHVFRTPEFEKVDFIKLVCTYLFLYLVLCLTIEYCEDKITQNLLNCKKSSILDIWFTCHNLIRPKKTFLFKLKCHFGGYSQVKGNSSYFVQTKHILLSHCLNQQFDLLILINSNLSLVACC